MKIKIKIPESWRKKEEKISPKTRRRVAKAISKFERYNDDNDNTYFFITTSALAIIGAACGGYIYHIMGGSFFIAFIVEFPLAWIIAYNSLNMYRSFSI